jgi:hypothetical protein
MAFSTGGGSGGGGGASVADGPGADDVVDAAGAAGVSASAARVDHGHKVATSATAGAAVGTAAAGTSGHAPSRDNHVHPTGAGTPSTQNYSDTPVVGTGPAAAMTDHKHGMPAVGGGGASGGTPAIVLGTAAAAGSAGTFLRDDDTILAFDATTPATQVHGDTGVVGSATTAARRDHKHVLADLSGDVSTTGSMATTIGANKVTLAKMATQADQTILGNVVGSSAVPVALTMAQVITALAGQVGGLPVIGELASDLNFTVSNTTLQNITGMTFNIGASATEIWLIEVFLEVNAANSTMDMKFGWATMPTAATMRWGGVSGNPANVAGYGAATTAVAPLDMFVHTGVLTTGMPAAATTGIMLVGKVFGGGTAGAIQLMAAQNTSDGGQLTAKKGSVLRATKLVA